MNEFTQISQELRAAGKEAAAAAAEGLKEQKKSMKVSHPGQAAYGGQAWNGWRFQLVREELKLQRVSPEIGLLIINTMRELEENERMN